MLSHEHDAMHSRDLHRTPLSGDNKISLETWIQRGPKTELINSFSCLRHYIASILCRFRLLARIITASSYPHLFLLLCQEVALQLVDNPQGVEPVKRHHKGFC